MTAHPAWCTCTPECRSEFTRAFAAWLDAQPKVAAVEVQDGDEGEGEPDCDDREDPDYQPTSGGFGCWR